MQVTNGQVRIIFGLIDGGYACRNYSFLCTVFYLIHRNVILINTICLLLRRQVCMSNEEKNAVLLYIYP